MLYSVVGEDGLEVTVTDVMSTLSLLGSVADAVMAGLVAPVIHALLTLDLLDNATNVWEDGREITVTLVLTDGFLQPVIRSVMDSAAVTMTTVRVVSRMVDGRQHLVTKFI